MRFSRRSSRLPSLWGFCFLVMRRAPRATPFQSPTPGGLLSGGLVSRATDFGSEYALIRLAPRVVSRATVCGSVNAIFRLGSLGVDSLRVCSLGGLLSLVSRFVFEYAVIRLEYQGVGS